MFANNVCVPIELSHVVVFLFQEYTSRYRPQRSLGKVIFSQASVILLRGGCLLLGGLPPRGCFLGGVWGGVASFGGAGGDPPGRLLLRAAHILLECILVYYLTAKFIWI